jgi:Carboxypeptidase regulatory-like domain/TonB-dependent Receptor Plug Domain
MSKVYNFLQHKITCDKKSHVNFAANLGFVLMFFMVMFLVPAGLLAQTGTTGQISGNVTDQAGAVVSGATITATSTATGAKRTAQTTGDGNYSIVNLDIGVYKVSVSGTGFKATTISNVIVNVSNTTRQDVSLEPGGISETVNITADAVQVETQTGVVGEIVSGDQVRELPLNGRSFTQLTQLQPGVSAANNFDSKQKGLFGGVDFSVNGNSGQSNLFLTDGANNNDTGSNRTILLFPSIEAIAEFKSLRNSYGPEYGQAAGAIVSIATRGGSNKIHGSAYYFGRNDAINATEFFANKNKLTKGKLRRNDYGFSLGGPIVKDRLFFFYSQEFNQEIRGQSRFGRVPTAAERTGDLRTVNGCGTGNIGNGRPGEGTNIIPAANISPAGVSILKIFPLANRTPAAGSCNNWAFNANSPIKFREENIRIDYTITEKNKIFGRYTQDTWSNKAPNFVGNLWGDDAFPTIEGSWAQPSKQAAIKLTTQLSSTAINDVQFAYSANRINITQGNGSDINREINTAVPGFFPTSGKLNGLNRPHPVFWGGIAPFNAGGDPNLWTQQPFKNALDIYSVRDDASMVKGNHVLKTGFLYDTAAKNEDSGPNNEAIQFWGPCCGNNSGNAVADVLTKGSLFGFNETNRQPVGKNRYKNLEFYFGDTWKVKPNFTLELGARYSILYEPTDAANKISAFSPGLYDSSKSPLDSCNGLVVPKGTNPCAGITYVLGAGTAADPFRTVNATTPKQFSNRSLRANNYKNLAPRLGAAWDVFSDGKTAIRGGFGLFYLRERTSPYFAGLTLNSPFANTIGGQRTLGGDGVGGLPIFSGLSAASAGSPKYGLSPEAATPYSMQFNVSASRQLFRDTVLEVGYVGNRSRKQLTHNDVNQVKEANRKAAAFAGDANAVNALRPYSNYGAIYQFERNGRGNYDSMQVLFRTKFTKSLQLQAAYTYSRSLADFGLNDSSGSQSDFAVLDRNRRSLDFAESDINRPHIFVANFIYNLPAFKDRNALVSNLFGGWEIASIIQASSGTSLTPRLFATGINNLQAGLGGLGTAVANQRPIRVASEPCTTTNDKGTFLNKKAWTLVGYKIGESNIQRTTCLGPNSRNVDLSFYKNFSPSWLTGSALGEGARIQFRFEMFNAFNTPQFRGDSLQTTFYNGSVTCGANPCSATNNTVTSAGVAGDFGVSGKSKGAREIQYALKLYF